MMAAMFTACSNDDNPVNNNPRPLDDEDATLVTNDQELRNAIKDGASIKLANDIQLSNSTLSIESGTKVAINLGGYALDRKLTKRGEGGGQVITVRKNATLNLKNGTLKGGWGRDGGGLVNEGGTVTLTDVNITGNTADDRGGGISNHGTLTMTGGSITGNTTNDQTDPKGGGGIMNSEGATATLTNVTITGNTVTHYGGGGICNYGTLTLDGCTITGNTAGTYGGGIWQKGTLNMQGKNTVTDNKGKDGMADNVYLKKDAVITVTGALTGSSIGVTMEKNTGVFTSGYNTKNAGVDPATLFKADLPNVLGVSLDDNNEAQLTDALPEGSVYYIERSWDADNFKVKTTVMTVNDAVVLSNSGAITLTKKLYVVKDNITINGRILIKPEDNESVGIILCDGAKLKSNYDIVFDESTTKAKLHIYGQANNSGKLDMSDNAGTSAFVRIGNTYYDGHDTEGEINIHGGDLDVNGNNMCPAIGAYSISSSLNEYYSEEAEYFIAKSGVINIYGGTVRAYGGKSAAGIGSGLITDDYGTINIYGGHITAAGRCPDILSKYSGGAGIGGGNFCGGGTLNIYGGDITAIGADEAAGIGCGQGSIYKSESYSPGNINIYGGTVVAQGGVHGAGIGGGDGTSGTCNIKISGGHVIGKGGTDAAGIGGGEGGPGGNITISGGYVEAYGNDYGAGIGGGQDGAGGTISITGGTVFAKAGRDETGWRAFGPGSGSDDYGKLTIGDLMMVYSERMAAAVERHDMCWYRTDVHVELCTHPGYTADTCPYHKH